MNTNSRTKNSIINISTSIGGYILLAAVSFVTRTVFINTLGVSYLGIDGLFSDILRLLSLTELGIDTAMNYKLYKPISQQDIPRVRVLMKFYALAYRIVGCAFLGIGICIIPLLPILIKDYSSLAELGISAPLIFVIFLVNSASSYLFFASRIAMLHADQKSYIPTMIGFIVGVISNMTQIVILLLYHDYMMYSVITVLYTIIQSLVTAYVAKCCYPEIFKKTSDKMSRKEIKDTFKDLGALFIYNVNSVVLKSTDNIVLSSFIGIATVGLYSNYLLFYTAINSLIGKVYSSIKASMGNLFASESIEVKYKFFERMNMFSVVAYGTGGVGIAICANELIDCWIGEDYVIAQPLSILIGIQILFAGLKMNLGQVRSVTGLYRQMWYRPMIGVVINIVISIVLVYPFGIYGVVIGTITADFFANFLIDPRVIHKYYFEEYKNVGIYYKKNAIYIFILSCVGAVDYLICKYIYFGNKWSSLIIHIIICGVSVPSVFLLLYRNTDEGEYFINLIKGRLRKSK